MICCREMTKTIPRAPPDAGVIGTTGKGAAHDRVWGGACAACGIALDELPWIRPRDGGEPIRLYWNSGVWAYRRSTGLGADYLKVATLLLDAGISFSRFGEHWLEQMSLGLAGHRLKLRSRSLPLALNYTVSESLLDDTNSHETLSSARLIHYHDSMSPATWHVFLAKLLAAHPGKFDWLERLGPVTNPASRSGRFSGELLRIVRGIPRWWYRSHRATQSSHQSDSERNAENMGMRSYPGCP